MKISKVRVIGRTTVDFPIVGALPSDSFICKGVDGLGAPKRDVAISETVDQGGQYQGSHVQYRQVVIRVGLSPNYAEEQTTETLRGTLYGLLSPGPSDIVDIHLMMGEDVVLKTRGPVETIDPVIFSKSPQVQIVIPCLDAPLYGPDEVTVLAGVGATDDYVIDYEGSYPSGFKVDLLFAEDLPFFIVTKDGKEMRIDHFFDTDDQLTIDTRAGLRSIVKTVGAVETNIIKDLSSDSTWLDLYPGDNNITTNNAGYTWNYAARYTPLYWGI